MCDLEMFECVYHKAQEIVEFDVSKMIWSESGAVKLEAANAWG